MDHETTVQAGTLAYQLDTARGSVAAASVVAVPQGLAGPLAAGLSVRREHRPTRWRSSAPPASVRAGRLCSHHLSGGSAYRLRPRTHPLHGRSNAHETCLDRRRKDSCMAAIGQGPVG